MSVYTLCLVAAGALTAGSALSRILREGLEARELIERVPLVQIGDGATGWVRISGRVRAPAETLRAPWSGREAVFFELRVGSSRAPAEPRRGRQRQLAAVLFEIDDGTGRALVRIPPAAPNDEAPEILTALPASRHARHWGLGGTPPDLLRLMAGFAIQDGGELPFTATERIIVPGDRLTIAGYAKREANPSGTSGSFRSMPTLMVLEATSEHALALASPRVLASWWGA